MTRATPAKYGSPYGREENFPSRRSNRRFTARRMAASGAAKNPPTLESVCRNVAAMDSPLIGVGDDGQIYDPRFGRDFTMEPGLDSLRYEPPRNTGRLANEVFDALTGPLSHLLDGKTRIPRSVENGVVEFHDEAGTRAVREAAALSGMIPDSVEPKKKRRL